MVAGESQGATIDIACPPCTITAVDTHAAARFNRIIHFEERKVFYALDCLHPRGPREQPRLSQ